MLIQPIELSLPYKYTPKNEMFHIDSSDLSENLARFFKATFYKSVSSTVIDNSYQTEFFVNDTLMNLSISLRDRWFKECPGVIYLGVARPQATPMLDNDETLLLNVNFYVDYESLTYLRLLDE